MRVLCNNYGQQLCMSAWYTEERQRVWESPFLGKALTFAYTKWTILSSCFLKYYEGKNEASSTLTRLLWEPNDIMYANVRFKPGGSIWTWTLVFKELSSRKVTGDANECDTSRWSIHGKPENERTTMKSYHTPFIQVHKWTKSKFWKYIFFSPEAIQPWKNIKTKQKVLITLSFNKWEPNLL